MNTFDYIKLYNLQKWIILSFIGGKKKKKSPEDNNIDNIISEIIRVFIYMKRNYSNSFEKITHWKWPGVELYFAKGLVDPHPIGNTLLWVECSALK